MASQKCPKCHADAYVGLFAVECTNHACSSYVVSLAPAAVQKSSVSPSQIPGPPPVLPANLPGLTYMLQLTTGYPTYVGGQCDVALGSVDFDFMITDLLVFCGQRVFRLNSLIVGRAQQLLGHLPADMFFPAAVGKPITSLGPFRAREMISLSFENITPDPGFQRFVAMLKVKALSGVIL